MTCSRVLVGASVTLLLLGAGSYREAIAQAPDVASDPLSLAGCYRLTFHAHSSSFPSRQLERRLWLTTSELAAMSGDAAPSYVARPAPGERASQFEAVYWVPRPEGHGLVLTWASGFHGVTVVLRGNGKSLRSALTGEAHTFTDVLGAPSATASVNAVPIECES